MPHHQEAYFVKTNLFGAKILLLKFSSLDLTHPVLHYEFFTLLLERSLGIPNEKLYVCVVGYRYRTYAQIEETFWTEVTVLILEIRFLKKYTAEL